MSDFDAKRVLASAALPNFDALNFSGATLVTDTTVSFNAGQILWAGANANQLTSLAPVGTKGRAFLVRFFNDGSSAGATLQGQFFGPGSLTGSFNNSNPSFRVEPAGRGWNNSPIAVSADNISTYYLFVAGLRSASESSVGATHEILPFNLNFGVYTTSGTGYGRIAIYKIDVPPELALNSVIHGNLKSWLLSPTVTANAGTGNFAVSAASLPLPSGAATSANQTTANTSLSNIDTDIGALADSAASTDTGSFSLISLFKRLLSTKLPDQSSGRIPVTLASAGTTGSTAPTNANLIGGTDGTNLRGLSVDSSGRLNTNINGTVPVSGAVTANNQSVYSSGALTLSGTSALNTDLITSTVTAYQELIVQVTGTWPTGATIQHQVSNDNVNFGSIVASSANAISGTLSSTITNTGSYKVLLNGFAYYRLRVTVAGSAGTYSYAYTLNPRSSVFNASVSVSSAPTTPVNIVPSTGNGHSTHHTAISAASTNATNVKGSNANIGSLNLVNTTASLRYFKLFNSATAPTVGTSTPVLNYAIPPNSSMFVDCGYAGIRLATGLSYAITAGQALLDNTAVGAGDVVVNIAYA